MIGRVRNAVSSYVWFSAFFVLLVLVFSVGFQPLVCETFWIDRLWYLILIIPISGICSMVNYARAQPGDFDGEWWSRFMHTLVSTLLLIFFAVAFFAYLLPAFVNANKDSADGGKCNNPFNAPAWFCVYNNTMEASLCDLPPCASADLCTVGHDASNLPRAFAHYWLFIFVIVFLVMGVVDLVLQFYLHRLSIQLRLALRKGGALPGADSGFVERLTPGVQRVESGMPVMNRYKFGYDD